MERQTEDRRYWKETEKERERERETKRERDRERKIDCRSLDRIRQSRLFHFLLSTLLQSSADQKRRIFDLKCLILDLKMSTF